MKKRMITILMVMVMLVSMLTACGKDPGSSTGGETKEPSVTKEAENPGSTEPDGKETAQLKTPKDFETFKIGVSESQSNDQVALRRLYYQNYVAPKYNVEFIFSEQLKDTEAELNFIENCADMGVKAIISYRSDDVNQMVQVSQEYGILYTVNTTRTPRNEESFTYGSETYQGVWGTEPPRVSSEFKKWLENVASEDGSEGFMITSALAFRGNTMHAECTQGVLLALQELYGLKYEDTIENIAATAVPLEVPNDKGINIYIYPGTNSTTDSWVQGASTALQTGKYGVLLQPAPTYTYTGVTVDEVERGFDMNIKVASNASISETLKNAFNTQDKFGNPSLDMVTIQSVSLLSGMGFANVYNALTGYGDLNRGSANEPMAFDMPIWVLNTKEQVDKVCAWDDATTDKWIFDENAINKILGIYNPDLTTEDVVNYYGGLDYNWVEEQMK